MSYILSRYINLPLCERNTQKIFNSINLNIRKSSLWWKCQESRIGYNQKNRIFYKINMPLKYYTSNNVQQFVDSFKNERNELMTIWPDIVRELTEEDNEELSDINKWTTEILEYNVPKGEKWRSVSLIVAYKLLASQDQLTKENIRLARILAWCIEIMHAVHIVMNDIVDHADMRRNQPTWHVKVGLGAINDALIMETCIQKLLEKHFKLKNCYVELMNIFWKYNKKTGHGHRLDIFISTNWRKKANFDLFSMDRYNTLVKYKMSCLSFIFPFSLAMRFAGVIDSEMHREAEKILLKIGHFYQVQNDFLNYYSKEEIGGKSETDIQEGKCTWPIVIALERATAEQKRILRECYGVADEEKVKHVKEIYDKIGISNIYFDYEEETHNLLNTYIQQLSSKLPSEYFLYLLATSCSKVGRKH
ncbi:farnesyl pyrophosphate synthase [Apis mellifera]|uniref:Farnesyl pyrophosphate synthase n=1 Tax=Apis mellifera TaxID=7460 RepID=A0A7M7RA64_APIME|nr:farnesyl pyrophosphate synthase [Apis mellifera]XP_624298.3 farnesyl pyrophosphate synthase [Apis mellifera]|eukprot:XP_026300396.1 farnesyl pyrophosphate synthase [Apis mellifera]